jgi:hypothetical protein
MGIRKEKGSREFFILKKAPGSEHHTLAALNLILIKDIFCFMNKWFKTFGVAC